MNIKRAKEEIKSSIEAYLKKDEHGNYEIPVIRQRPILLIGPPGVGKTQIMEETARECGIAFVSYTITHHTRQSAIGLPYITKLVYNGTEYSITEYTMSEIVASIYHKMEQTGLKEGLLFIDEINCVSETLAPTMLQFLQGKTFGAHKIPDGWMIAAAGNPPEYNKSVREFDIVTLDRIRMIPIEPDFDAWREYAYKTTIHAAILSYLTIKPQYFCQMETTIDGRFFATPRGWEDLSRLIEVYEKLDKKVDRELVYQYIQSPGIAKDFSNYLELYYRYRKEYQVEEILEGKIQESVLKRIRTASFDEKISMTGLLLAGLSREFKRLQEKEGLLEFMMRWLRLFPEQLEQNAYQRLEHIIKNCIQEWKQKREAELLSKAEDIQYQNGSKIMEAFAQVLTEENQADPDTAWERLKELFSKQNQEYEEHTENAGRMLENAFDFMEAGFGDSQEMVIFITELNMNYYCIYFLQRYECERYFQYNKKLLFEDEEGKLHRQLERFQI